MYDLPKKIVDALPLMEDSTAGKLAKMIAAYYSGMQLPDADALITVMFESIKPELESSMKASEAHREAGKKGGRPSKKKMSKQYSPSEEEPTGKLPKAKRFIPPTLEEVVAYCSERGNNIDPEHFMDYYTANGWKQKSGNPVKDWKSCVRLWETNDKKRRANQQSRSWQSPLAATPFGGSTKKDPFQILKEQMRMEGTLDD